MTPPADPRASAIYRGRISHTRMAPKRHAFSYPVHMVYLDLDELPEPFGRSSLFSARRPAPARFKRGDYFGDPAKPLDVAIRDLVENETGERPDGPIRLLTNLRTFGYIFNPISVYYCFDAAGERLTHLVAHVSNIPYGESHPYVFRAAPNGTVAAGEVAKQMYVSPFLEMDYTYRLRGPLPDDQLHLSVANLRDGEVEFAAALELRRTPATAANLRRTLLRQPVMAASVTARIFWQAARLRLKGLRVQPRPAAKPGVPEPTDKLKGAGHGTTV